MAKGVAILLVAVHHATLFALSVHAAPARWATATAMLQSFRMPLFFLVSGLLTSSSLRRGWGDLFRRKLLLWGYLCVLWSVLSILLYRVVEWTRTDMRHDGNLWVELVKMPLWPSTGLWYLLALPLFLTAVRAAQGRLAPRVQLVLAGLLALGFGAQWRNTGNKFYDGMAMYFVFFVVGAHARTLVFQASRRVASRRVTTGVALGVTAAYLVLTGTVTAGGWLSVPTVRPLLGCMAVACGVALSSRVADGWPGRALAVVGRQTLPIYVTNELLLALLVRPLGCRWCSPSASPRCSRSCRSSSRSACTACSARCPVSTRRPSG